MNESSTRKFNSWGRVFPSQRAALPTWLDQVSPLIRNAKQSVLVVGQGRSYGDSCLNHEGELIQTIYTSRVVSFDREQGVICAEAGITLAELLKIIVPAGWFLPITPGTWFVSLGGAVANDVHGKNHHLAGTFGCAVTELLLERSDGSVLTCSPQKNEELFSATVGGLGLTGFIRTVTLRLKKIRSHRIVGESIQFRSLDEFFALTSDSDKQFEYTVAWLDCVWSSTGAVRGVFIRGNHETVAAPAPWRPRNPHFSVPCEAPELLLNPWSIKLFNTLYFHKQLVPKKNFISSFEPFFYPLDSVSGWSQLYGKRGFFQFQCVVPRQDGDRAIREILQCVGESQAGSFLAVLKEFGSIPSPGLLSFVRPGITLCLDFANRGEKTRALLERLDNLTAQLGGAIYPAKDAIMSQRHFAQYFPQLNRFSRSHDAKFSSDLWRRVTN